MGLTGRVKLRVARDFDLLWAGESISALGTQLSTLALPTLAILDLHASAFEVGVLAACSFGGYPVAGILGGAGLFLATDQRGISIPQPSGGQMDIGAFESRGFTLALFSGDNQQRIVNTPFANPLVVSVTSAFNVATGSRIFQPKLISWS